MTGVWLRRYETAAPGAPRLVCFPHAGGTAAAFVPLARALAPEIEVLAVQYPGRQDRRTETPATDLRSLAGQLARVLAGLDDGPPLAFFGHSMGALVAFEVALRAERAPDVLFTSGARAPSLTEVNPRILASDAALVAEVRALGGTAGELLQNEDLRELVLPAIYADYRALAAYTAQPDARLDVPICALVGDQDPRVSVAQAQSWAGHTTGSFGLRVLAGGHFFLIPRLPEVARVVETELAARSDRRRPRVNGVR